MAEIMKISVRIKDSGLVSFLFPLTYLSHSYFLLSFFFSFLTFELSKRRNSVCHVLLSQHSQSQCHVTYQRDDITYHER